MTIEDDVTVCVIPTRGAAVLDQHVCALFRGPTGWSNPFKDCLGRRARHRSLRQLLRSASCSRLI
jgi:hypothetical protein